MWSGLPTAAAVRQETARCPQAEHLEPVATSQNCPITCKASQSGHKAEGPWQAANQLKRTKEELLSACNARSGFHLDSTPYKILSVAASMAKVLQLFVLPVSGSHRSAGRDQTFGRPAAEAAAWQQPPAVRPALHVPDRTCSFWHGSARVQRAAVSYAVAAINRPQSRLTAANQPTHGHNVGSHRKPPGPTAGRPA